MTGRLDPQAWLARPGFRALLDALDADSGTVRLVGGAVRDLLVGHTPGDLDLATLLSPADVIARATAARIKAIPTGIEHGTVTLVSRGTAVEVTTLRADVSTDGRRATVAFTDDWQADAARRDFSFNALYADPFSGAVSDYFGGLDDLSAGRVRFIGEPLQRIAEDHLRILQFFRFHARFGRGAPDGPALAACTARANDLMALSRERIADELVKLLALPDPCPTVAVMIDHGIFAPVLPEIADGAARRLAALVASEGRAAIAADPLRRLAALLPQDPALADRIAARLKLSKKARQRLADATDPAIDADPRALAYRIGIVSAQDRLLLAGRPDEAAEIGRWTVPRLPIGGGQLIARGVTQGPRVARMLRTIESRWIAAGFPEGEAVERLIGQALADD